MAENTLNIHLLKAYIKGDLNAEESVFVEKQLAESELWRDVYEGLLLAEQQNIHPHKSVKTLREHIAKKQPAQVVRMSAWKRWATVAAALIGILIISYATVYLLSPESNGNGYELSGNLPQRNDFSTADEIEIIDATPANDIKEQQFSAEEIEKLPKQELITARIEPQHIEIEDTDFTEPQKIDNIIARNGYRQVTYNKSLREEKAAPKPLISEHATPVEGKERFEKEAAENYILRFPFNGIVTINFTVNPEGEVASYDVLKSSNSDATAAVVKLIKEKTTWKAAKDTAGSTTRERLQIEASFGNTIYVKVNPIQ